MSWCCHNGKRIWGNLELKNFSSDPLPSQRCSVFLVPSLPDPQFVRRPGSPQAGASITKLVSCLHRPHTTKGMAPGVINLESWWMFVALVRFTLWRVAQTSCTYKGEMAAHVSPRSSRILTLGLSKLTNGHHRVRLNQGRTSGENGSKQIFMENNASEGFWGVCFSCTKL